LKNHLDKAPVWTQTTLRYLGYIPVLKKNPAAFNRHNTDKRARKRTFTAAALPDYPDHFARIEKQ
jgi:hypothetical protein